MSWQLPVGSYQFVGITALSAIFGIAVTGAQAPATQKPGVARPATAKPPAIPRTADGHPDLQGNWTNATITPFERRGNVPLVLTEEAARLEESTTAADLEARDAPRADSGALPVGGEVRKSPNAEPSYLELLWRGGGGTVGGYNTFWIDPGDKVLRVDGQPRSSIIIDPPNGRLPAYTPAAQARIAAAAELRRSKGGEFDHPELRPNAERCIASFGNNAGPPMLPNYFYNNNYTIVQSKDTVLILTEMVHDARIVRINGTHPACRPAQVVRRFDRPVGRRHARHRDDEFPSQSRLPQFVGEPQGDGADFARRREDAQLSLHRRGSGDVHGAVHGRAGVQRHGAR
jgi:hypothetical protein